jgi:hypothetical protein
MARRKQLADPIRARIVDAIDAYLDSARDSIQMANDLADLLNALDSSGEKIEIDGNVVMGAFKKAGK